MLKSVLWRNTSRASKKRGTPFWLSAFVFLCLSLFVVGSVAQACHTHSEIIDSLPSRSQSSHQTTPENCPLCTAMHSALHVAGTSVVSHVEPTIRLVEHYTPTTPSFFWQFDLACRPPPTDMLRSMSSHAIG
ncbi:hypothetical protein AciPR4_2588 [Terriglobus saanensis SP1PR4]|uniref:DUF2946 domain-containing protein n=1 Tax=Terriglobus saanensis (strain ATCC BAA-1853 / DSM 23119 / SP1PR4) TaxID=401053 RepID=E8V118_TERSS|nr:hypothetical protein AciPR4_2588 [Terriglobus saanensis SP1PR4]